MPKLEITEENTKIIDSYKIPDGQIKRLVATIVYKRLVKNFPVSRTQESYIREIKAHNRLYKLGLWKSHTINTDLEEKQNIVYKLIYWLIGR